MVNMMRELIMREHRTFSHQYKKLAAVKKVVEQDLSCTQVTRYQGIQNNIRYDWQNAVQRDGKISIAIDESPRIDAELKRLR
jgi:transposase-like protein